MKHFFPAPFSPNISTSKIGICNMLSSLCFILVASILKFDGLCPGFTGVDGLFVGLAGAIGLMVSIGLLVGLIVAIGL